jgi:hypothetical protein
MQVGMVPNGHRSGRAFSHLTISREPVDRLNPQQPHQIFGGYSYMRWFIVSALFLSSFSFVLNAEYANKHSNKNKSPPDFAELHRENYIWGSSWPSYTGDNNHWSGQVWYKYVGTTQKLEARATL